VEKIVKKRANFHKKAGLKPAFFEAGKTVS
jgi:hypothetical protein